MNGFNMFSGKAGVQIFGIMGSELVIEEILYRDKGALMAFWVVWLAV
jgi:hypothetical protein